MEAGVWRFTVGSNGAAPVVVRMPQSMLPMPLARSESLWQGNVADFALAVSQLGANGVMLNLPLSDLCGEDRLSLAQIAAVGSLIRKTADRTQKMGVSLFIEISNVPMPAWLASAGGIDGPEGRTHLGNAMSILADSLGPAVGVAAVMPDIGLSQPPMGRDNWDTFKSGGSAIRLWKQWRAQSRLPVDDDLPAISWNKPQKRYEIPQTRIYEIQRFRSWLFLQRWAAISAGAVSENSKLRWGCHLPDGKLGLMPGEADQYAGILGVDMPATCTAFILNLGEYPYKDSADANEWVKRSVMMLRMSVKGNQTSVIAEVTTKLSTDAALASLKANMVIIRKHCAGLVLGNIELASALGREAIAGIALPIKRSPPRAFVRLSRIDELAPVKPGRLIDLLKTPLLRIQQTDGQWDNPK